MSADTPTVSLADDGARFYGVLRGIERDARDAIDGVADVAREQVAQHRRLLGELDQLRERVIGEIDRWAQIVHGLNRDGADGDDGPRELRGRAIGDQAAVVLEEVGGEWHYAELLAEVERRGFVVVGANPQATLLNQLHRHPRIESVQPRSGLWRLAG